MSISKRTPNPPRSRFVLAPLLAACAAAIAMAATAMHAHADPADTVATGVYSGTYDPPTIAHVRIIRDAAERYSLGRFRVVINAYPGYKDYFTAADERELLLRAGLDDAFAERGLTAPPIDFVHMTTSDWKAEEAEVRNAYRGPVFQMLGQDSFEKSSVEEMRAAPARWTWLLIPREDEAPSGAPARIPDGVHGEIFAVESVGGMSSSAYRHARATGADAAAAAMVYPGVDALIRERGLYALPAGPEAEARLRAEHAAAYRAFARAAGYASAGEGPPFTPQRSRAGWRLQFTNWIVRERGLSGEAERALRGRSRAVVPCDPKLWARLAAAGGNHR